MKKAGIIIGSLAIVLMICLGIGYFGMRKEKTEAADEIVEQESGGGKTEEEPVINEEQEKEEALEEEQAGEAADLLTYEEFLEVQQKNPDLFPYSYMKYEYMHWEEALTKLAECEIVFDRTLQDEWTYWRNIIGKTGNCYYAFRLDEDGLLESYEPDFNYEGEKVPSEPITYEGSLNEQAHQAYEAFLAGKDYCYSEEWDYQFSMEGTIEAWYLNDVNAANAYPLLERWCSYEIESNYLLVDFDEDGEDELFYYFLGGGMGDGDYLLVKYDEEKGLICLYQEPAGARGRVNVRDNGVFVDDGSGGASVHAWDYYRISAQGEQEMLAEYYLDFQNDAKFTCYVEPSLSYTLKNPHAEADTYDERSLTEEDLKEIEAVISSFEDKYCGSMLEWEKTVLNTRTSDLPDRPEPF